jgi:hypothetical protein
MKKILMVLLIFTIKIYAEPSKSKIEIKYLTDREIEEYHLNKDLAPYYFVKTENFPIDKIYTYKTKNLNESEHNMGEFIIGESEMLKCKDFYKKESAIFSANNTLPGEPIDFILESIDKLFKISQIFILKPLESKTNGKVLSLTIINPERTLFWFKLFGCKPNEQIFVCSCSENEVGAHLTNADEKGELVGNIAPSVIGKTSGKAQFEIRTLQNELLKIDFNWGNQTCEGKILDNKKDEKNLKFSANT